MIHNVRQARAYTIGQAKENADDLVAQKKELDQKVAAKKQESKDFEILLKKKARGVGNIVGKNVPVSQTEVRKMDFPS